MEGKDNALQKLQRAASDPRWRIREAVAMALQMIGLFDMDWLIAIAVKWVKGNYYEQRAAVAGLCEPSLLWDKRHAGNLFKILNISTENIVDSEDRGSDGFQVLKKGLGYCWSVAVAAYPDEGKVAMERWLESNNSDIRWIIKQNLNKKRLRMTDSEWVRKMQDKLNSSPLVMNDN
ncbi:MAG: hypothetical protein U5K69_08090 [Balneolaceae bacterium]|nr:hypothetical protein [Balneolaceae bacterium]